MKCDDHDYKFPESDGSPSPSYATTYSSDAKSAKNMIFPTKEQYKVAVERTFSNTRRASVIGGGKASYFDLPETD